jgi:Rieske Fe-S protein
MKKSRREFLFDNLKLAGIGLVGISTIGTITSCEKDKEIIIPPQGIRVSLDLALSENQDIAKLKNGWGVVRRFEGINNGIHVVITKINAEIYTCFSSLCTHDSCFGDKLFVQPRRAIIACSCHGSEFDAANNGKVLKGPAERPLREFPTAFDKDANILHIDF